jgi:hypothetical protein
MKKGGPLPQGPPLLKRRLTMLACLKLKWIRLRCWRLENIGWGLCVHVTSNPVLLFSHVGWGWYLSLGRWRFTRGTYYPSCNQVSDVPA